jgi:hypothetical protein
MPTNSEARKGIKTEEGALMADKAFQLDRNATDADGDGNLSTYEQVKAEAILSNTQFCMPSFVCSS